MDGMAAFVAERIRVESDLDALMSMTPEDRTATIDRIKQEAEAKSAFKKHQLVRACQSPGFSLTEGPLPHNHDDPKQHFDSRVVGWDSFGRIQIASRIYGNPHCSEGPWSENMIHSRDDDDWAGSSTFKIELDISFEWEHNGWPERLGRVTPAVLKGPHIELGDWLILYEKPCGMWIPRVLNEQYMRPR